MRIYQIQNATGGVVGMMARPRGGNQLPTEVETLKRYGFTDLVCLLETDELYELELEKEKTACQNTGIRFHHFPIKDRHVPDDPHQFFELVNRIYEKWENGDQIVVHCRAGIGRTGIFCAALLLKAGHDPLTVFDELREKRTLSVPDTDEQKEWVLKHAKDFLK